MRPAINLLPVLALAIGACGVGAIDDYAPGDHNGSDAGDGDAAGPAPEPSPSRADEAPSDGCDPATCDDGDPCNGEESCEGGACVAGTPVLDADGDGHRRADCGGDDCDDLDADARPGGEEVCYDGADNDCDGTVDPPRCTLRGDSCADPIPLRVPAGGSIRKDFWLDLSAFGRDHNVGDAECCPWPTCAAGADCCPWEGGGPDAVYRLELAAETTVTLDLVSEEPGGEPLDVILSLRSGCGAATIEQCWDDLSDAGDSGTRILVRDQVLPAGTYYLFVDCFEADPFEPSPEAPNPDSYRVHVILEADA